MKAPVKASDSFLWRGLVAAREVLFAGGCWRIRDGYDVTISDDKWVTGMNEGRVLVNPITYVLPVTMADLIQRPERHWNEDLLNMCFSDSQVCANKSIPLSV
ncbi:hypothetical protein ACFE04_026646 [Oxalis oulophora]